MGPKHVAETIMVEQRKHDRTLNDEQLLLFALWVFILQEAFVRRPNPEEPYLALDTDLCDILVDGWGWMWEDNANQSLPGASIAMFLRPSRRSQGSP